MHQGEKLKEIVESYCALHNIHKGSISEKIGLKARTAIYGHFKKEVVKPDIIVAFEEFTGNTYIDQFYPNLYQQKVSAEQAVAENEEKYYSGQVKNLNKKVEDLNKKIESMEDLSNKKLAEINNELNSIKANMKVKSSVKHTSLDQGKGA